MATECNALKLDHVNWKSKIFCDVCGDYSGKAALHVLVVHTVALRKDQFNVHLKGQARTSGIIIQIF